MAIPNLYSDAAGLLRGTGDIVLGSRKLDEEAKNRGAEITNTGMKVAGNVAERAIAERGATQRQQMSDDAQMIEITPQLAKGAQNVTGDASWGDMVGKKLRADVYSGLLVHGQRRDLQANWKPIEITEGGKTRTAIYNEKTGERIELGTPGTGKRSRGSGSNAMDPKDKEFIKTFRQNQKDTENWNYELLKGLSTTDPKQAEDLQGKLDFIQENQDRFDALQGLEEPKPKKGAAAPKGAPAPAAGGTGGGISEAQIDEYLTKRKAKNTPANRAWAKEQLGG